MTMHYLGDDYYSLEEQEEMEREKNKNYDVWKFRTAYIHQVIVKKRMRKSNMFTNFSGKAKIKLKVMKEILTRRAFMNEHLRKIRKKEDAEEVFDWWYSIMKKQVFS